MASINLRNASVSFPFYDAQNRSLRQRFVRASTDEILFNHQDEKQFIQAVSNITLELGPGDRLAILGENGVGKTTLLRVMGGLLKPNGGTAQIDGTPMAVLDIGFGFDSSMTLSDTITAYGLLRGKTLLETYQAEESILEFFSLSAYRDRRIRNLPAGCLFRLCSGLAFFYEASIILFDEVFDGADSVALEKVREFILQEFPADGIIAIAERTRTALTGICNKALILQDGQVLNFGEYDAIISEYCDTHTL
jgi:ABC-2 type transport system ATP-binding protein